MATQLKHTDFAFSTALTPRPNIRVVYTAGDAAIAMRSAMEVMPVETREATLEELANLASVHAVRTWDAACEAVDDAFRKRDAYAASTMDPMNRAARLMKEQGIPARTVIDFIAPAEAEFSRLAIAAVRSVEDLVEVPAADAVGLAHKIRLLNHADFYGMTDDMGSVNKALDRDATALLAVPEPDPFMRGPLIQWQRAYDRYVEANDAAEKHHRDVELPADERYGAVRAKWPTDYDFSRDPAANAELDAADYPEVVEESNRLWSDSTDRRTSLYLVPAPSPVEFAVKMKLFQEEQDWQLCRAKEIVKQLTHDARRFGRHGAHLQTDSAVLYAFAQFRAAMIEHRDLPDGASAADEDACFARMDGPIQTLLDTRTTTIEGVLAKLRLGYKAIGQDRYIDGAVIDPTSNAFRDGLAMGSVEERILWSAVEDLARIGGVSLSEQGA